MIHNNTTLHQVVAVYYDCTCTYGKLCELKGDVASREVNWLSLYSEVEPLRGKCWTITNQLKEITLSASNTRITSHLTIATEREGINVVYGAASWTGRGCGLPRGDGVI